VVGQWIFGSTIRMFESWRPSQPTKSLPRDFRVRHGLGGSAPVSLGPFTGSGRAKNPLCRVSLRALFSISVSECPRLVRWVGVWTLLQSTRYGASVDSELKRRRPTSARPNAKKASAAQPAAAATASRGQLGELDAGTAVPAGRASLIKASYQAGMKPVAIARSLRVSLSIVNKVLSTESKPRR
jgi:hypothetical protein